MKSRVLFLVVWLVVFHFGKAQDFSRDLMASMIGDFYWEMTKPSTHLSVKKGERVSEPYFNGCLFLFHETFYDSEIEQVGFFGYDTRENKVLSVGLYNVAMGPHVLKGYPQQKGQGYEVTFFEGDKKIVLYVENRNFHYWVYYSKDKDQWIMDDLRIDFHRKPKE